MAQAMNIRVIGISPGRSKNEEIAAAGFPAHPEKGGIEVFAPADQGESWLRFCGYILRIANPEVVIWRWSLRQRERHKQSKNSKYKNTGTSETRGKKRHWHSSAGMRKL
jgi:hypothetical protein